VQKTKNRYFPTLADAAPCSSEVAKRETCRILRPVSRFLTNNIIAWGSDKAGRTARCFFCGRQNCVSSFPWIASQEGFCPKPIRWVAAGWHSFDREECCSLGMRFCSADSQGAAWMPTGILLKRLSLNAWRQHHDRAWGSSPVR